MAKKKVIDADLLVSELDRLIGRTFVSMPYNYGDNSGSVEAAMKELIRRSNENLIMNINAGLTTILLDLKTKIQMSAREEDGGMCGLCRVDPNQPMPVDYRPLIPGSTQGN